MTTFERVAWSLVTAALLSALTNYSVAAPADADKARRELGAIAKKLNDLDSWFSDAQSRQRELQKSIKTTDEKIAASSSAVRDTQQNLTTTRAELERLAGDREALEKKRREQAAKIAEHLTSAYRLSGQDFFKLLLNQQNPEELDRMMRYHRYFSDARADTLKAYQATLTELQQNETDTRAREAALAAQQRSLDADIARLKSNRGDREKLLAGLQGEMTGKEKERERLSADHKRLEKLLAELAKRTQAAPVAGAFTKNKGRMPWPMAGKVANSFGAARAGGKLKWQGIFIAAPEGTPVKAIHPGRVAFADWLRGFGLVTIVDHGGGYMSLYAHADALYRKPGESVNTGDAIATAGKSGGQSRSGLYFEIRARGEPSDPIPWLARR